jgi:hypothetical protein
MKRKPKRKVCTWCGRLKPVADLKPDPQHGASAPICKDRDICHRSVR